MANKSLFATYAGKLIRKADALNSEKAPAYSFGPKHALAQYAATGCLNATFYATGEEQLETVLNLCAEVDAEFIGKAAIYAREKGYMKDMPALLLAILSSKDREVFRSAFPRVATNAKMVRNFVQIMRSGVTGRKSLGTLPKKMVRTWLASRNDSDIFAASVGNDPSLADIIKMVHPKPADKTREALYSYLIGKDVEREKLPVAVADYERFKAGEALIAPDVPFMMLTSLPLTKGDWTAIAKNASWQTTRMNLNAFARHGVFEDLEAVTIIADRLRDEKLIRKAKVFPYQLMIAYAMTGYDVPDEVRNALQDAMEIATANVPDVTGKVFIFPDVSGSMRSPATGYRKGSTTAVRCVDVAALATAAIMRKNPGVTVVPFETGVVDIKLNPRDSIMTNAEKLASIGGGGTNCSAPLALLNRQKAKGDLVVYLSDNESWVDAGSRQATAVMKEWSVFKARNPEARLICIDIAANRTTQAYDRPDILNIGGFSDQVFELLGLFAKGEMTPEHWVGVIEKLEL